MTAASHPSLGPAPTAESFAECSIELHRDGQFDLADEALAQAEEMGLPRHVAPVAQYAFEREEWGEWPWLPGDSVVGPEWAAVNLVNYARRQPDPGGAQVFADYYTLYVGGATIDGQRRPADRLQYLPEDFFRDRTVLDIGGNFGGMLHVLQHDIRWGVGTDYDPRLINAANRIAAYNGAGKLRFYVHDLERDPLELMTDFLPGPRVDVVLLLAVCAHVRNWREVIGFAATVGDSMVFEANGHEYEQLGQLRALRRAYDRVEEVAGRGSPGIGSRRLYLCA